MANVLAQTVNVGYLNPQLGQADARWDYLRFGADANNFFGGIMHNVSDWTQGNGDDVVMLSYGRDLVMNPGGTGNFIVFPYQGGLMGVGTKEPQAPLHVTKNIDDGHGTGFRVAAILGNAWNHFTYFGGLEGARIRGDQSGGMMIEGGYGGNNTPVGGVLINQISDGVVQIAGGGGDVYLAPNGGSVTVGTFDAKGYDFAVGGVMVAEEVVIKQEGHWPDYVFASDYALPTLSEIKTYVEAHNHLPGVPSAAEVAETGIPVGEMNKILLEKVEELTLLLIEQGEKVEELQAEIEQLKGE
ncbi:MAG TPA: hypothetical protein DCR93_24750 [Cytophagales bacterium]|nr:hypothetical protein [Cytophagales bacterium]